MKLNKAFSRSGRRMAIRPPESGQGTGQDAGPALTPEQKAAILAKRGIRMRNPPASSLARWGS